MELVQEYVDQYEARQPKFIKIVGVGSSNEPSRNGRVYDEETVRRAFTSFSGADIVATFNGEVIGTIQSISLDARIDEPYELGSTVMERESTFIARPYEGTIELRNTEVNQGLLAELMGQQVSMSYGYYSEEPMPNRAERRKEQFKRRQKHDEELQDDYRKGLRKMMGGRKNWN